MTCITVISADDTQNEVKMGLAEIYEVLNEPRKALKLVYEGQFVLPASRPPSDDRIFLQSSTHANGDRARRRSLPRPQNRILSRCLKRRQETRARRPGRRSTGSLSRNYASSRIKKRERCSNFTVVSRICGRP